MVFFRYFPPDLVMFNHVLTLDLLPGEGVAPDDAGLVGPAGVERSHRGQLTEYYRPGSPGLGPVRRVLRGPAITALWILRRILGRGFSLQSVDIQVNIIWSGAWTDGGTPSHLRRMLRHLGHVSGSEVLLGGWRSVRKLLCFRIVWRVLTLPAALISGILLPFSFFSLVEVEVHLLRLHTHLQAPPVPAELAVCPVVSTDLALSMTKDTPATHRMSVKGLDDN